MNAIDICCGIGGLSIGLKKAGFNVAAGFDIDPYVVEAYNLNRSLHSGYGVVADLNTLTAKGVRNCTPLAEKIHLVAGCPPCQGFSRMRTKNGGTDVNDSRKNLVIKFIDLAISLNPDAILMENVPGLETTSEFENALKMLDAAGYFISWQVLDARFFGVPQHRKRLVLVGCTRCKVEVKVGKCKQRTVRDTLKSLPKAGISGDPLHDLLTLHAPDVVEKIRLIPKNGGSRSVLPDHMQLECHRGKPGFADVYGRMRWDFPSPTITGGCVNPSKGRFLHPSQNRAITLREALLLQGFPKSFTLPLTRGKNIAAQMIGNAFPPAFAKAHAIQIARAINPR